MLGKAAQDQSVRPLLYETRRPSFGQ